MHSAGAQYRQALYGAKLAGLQRFTVPRSAEDGAGVLLLNMTGKVASLLEFLLPRFLLYRMELRFLKYMML